MSLPALTLKVVGSVVTIIAFGSLFGEMRKLARYRGKKRSCRSNIGVAVVLAGSYAVVFASIWVC